METQVSLEVLLNRGKLGCASGWPVSSNSLVNMNEFPAPGRCESPMYWVAYSYIAHIGENGPFIVDLPIENGDFP